MSETENYGMERRSSIVLMQYWNELRGDKPLPHEDQIDPDRLDDIWERCFVVQIRDIANVKDYNYTYYGDHLREAHDDGLLEEEAGHIAGPEAKLLERDYLRVMSEGGPIMQENEYVDGIGRTVKYRQVFLPFGREDGTIDAILGGAGFKLG